MDNVNESARQNLDTAKKALSNIITLLDNVQENLNTSQKDVEKGHAVNNSIQATLQLLKEVRGYSHHETWLSLNSKSEDVMSTP